MRFLVGAQLPPALARWLADKGCVAKHVFDLGLETASDAEIWQLANQVDALRNASKFTETLYSA